MGAAGTSWMLAGYRVALDAFNAVVWENVRQAHVCATVALVPALKLQFD